MAVERSCASERRPRPRGSAGRVPARRRRCGRSPAPAASRRRAARRVERRPDAGRRQRSRAPALGRRLDRQRARADLAARRRDRRPSTPAGERGDDGGSRRVRQRVDVGARARQQAQGRQPLGAGGRDRGRGAASPRARRAGSCRGAARASAGCLLSGAIRSRAADDDPGLRAAEQLVAGEGDEVGAVRDRLARPSARAAGRSGRDRPACRRRGRSTSGTPCARARCAREVARRHRGGEALDRVVRGMHLHHQRRSSGRSRSRSRAACVRLVVPTSTSLAPARAMMSGMRNAPPISISSPRETIASRPAPAC